MVAGVRLAGPLLVLAWAPAAQAAQVSPVEKVVDILENLKSEVEAEGTAEAATYDTFTCFCKDTTAAKSASVLDGQDTINGLAASIEANTALKAQKSSELLERKKKAEEFQTELDTEGKRCTKEQTEFEATIADHSKAVDQLSKAVTALSASKPAFLQRTLADLADTLALAEVMGFSSTKGTASIDSFIQAKVDPNDPEYKFRSDGVVKTLTDMHEQFKGNKADAEADRDAAKASCDKTTAALTTLLSENAAGMDTLEVDIESLGKGVAEDRGSLVEAEEILKDDQTYMKDLTQKCEKAAKEWDSRSAGRSDELKALTEALAVLTQGGAGGRSVQELDAVNKRVVDDTSGDATAGRFLQQAGGRPAAELRAAPVLLQRSSSGAGVRREKLRSKLRGGGRLEVDAGSGKAAAADFLSRAAEQLSSPELSALAERVAADPFGKVKTLIQKLIQRLLDEATQEATKKGFCDTEVGKATQLREMRTRDLDKLTSERGLLEAKQATFNQSVAELEEKIPTLHTTLNETVSLRTKEKDQNLETIKTAKEGVEAVGQAISVLKVFYAKAANKKSLLQASPVDEDTEGPGFEGVYRGKQDGAHGVIGLLEVIKADFERTVRQTSEAEKAAQKDHVDFEQTSKADISSKETQVELEEQDLASIAISLETNMADMKTAQTMLDGALKTLEDLKPTCNPTMSYEDRVAKREEEIAALKNALTMLAA